MEPQQHPDWQIVDCPNCGMRVVFTSDGLCPACRLPSDFQSGSFVALNELKANRADLANKADLKSGSFQIRNELEGRRLRRASVPYFVVYFLLALPFAPYGFFIFLPFLLKARSLDLKGRRLSAPLAPQLLRRDFRSPVLYLRAFRDDHSRSMRTPAFSRCIFRELTVEEELAREMRSVGPFVAIGKPGEELPQLGAARMYVPDSQWQSRVRELMELSQLVVLRIGSSVTPGLSWEFSEAIKAVPTERLVIFFYPPRPVPDWMAQVIARPCSTTRLATYIYFDRDGVPKRANSTAKLLKAKRLRGLQLSDVIKIGAGFVIVTLMALTIVALLNTPVIDYRGPELAPCSWGL